MKSDEFKKILLEAREQQGRDSLSKNQVVVLEQKIFNELKSGDGLCRKCGYNVRLTLDHIIPKQLLRAFHIDPEYETLDNNYQLLCSICNHRKSGMLDFSIPETKKLLIELLKRV